MDNVNGLSRRSFLKVAGLAGLSFGLAACGNTSSSAASSSSSSAAASSDADKTYKIGVLQLTQHVALDRSNEGFEAALKEAGIKYTIDQQNASGDQSACQTIAEKLVNDGDDLILAIATPAVQAVAGVTTTIPIVGTAVTDFADSGLVKSNDAPGGNVTGSSDLTPVAEQIDLLKTLLPNAKTVGVLYCTAESNSEIQVKMAEEACKTAGLTCERYSVSSSNEIQQVVESAVGKVDALYCPTDNTIAAGMTTVTMVANEHKLPTICGETGMVEAGGLATYGIDYFELGKRAGKMAVRILTEGAKPAEMPIEHLAASECELSINDTTAQALGVDTSVVKK